MDRTAADVAMDRYAAGDEAAFADVYDAVAPRLFAYLRRRVADSGSAEDLVQQTMLQMHRARGSFIPQSPVVPWAFAIARRLLIDEMRREKRNVLAGSSPSEDDVPGPPADRPEAIFEAHDVARRLQEELVRLPETQRVAFEMMRMDGLSHTEAAKTLGVSVNAVKLRVHRAYLALRAVLGDGASESLDPPEG